MSKLDLAVICPLDKSGIELSLGIERSQDLPKFLLVGRMEIAEKDLLGATKLKYYPVAELFEFQIVSFNARTGSLFKAKVSLTNQLYD